MYLTAEKKQEIFGKFGKSNTDTGSTEGQIALFSYRINHLTEHLKLNKKDYSTERALVMLVGKRRRLLDYLKAKEFQQKRDNPDFKKTQRDDLLNMEIGILGKKGNVVFRFGNFINDELDKITEPDKRLQPEIAAQIIDKEIHRNYEIFPCNYIAYDLFYK